MTTSARQLANLRQNKGRHPKELEREATRIRKGTLDRTLRRIFALSELDVWLRGFADGQVPRSFFLQLVEEGPDSLVRHGLRTLEGMTPDRRDVLLDRMIEDENARINRFESVRAPQEAASSPESVSSQTP